MGKFSQKDFCLLHACLQCRPIFPSESCLDALPFFPSEFRYFISSVGFFHDSMALFSSRAFICLAKSLSPSVSDFRDDSFKMASGSGHGVASTMLVTPWLSLELIREDFRRVLLEILRLNSTKFAPQGFHEKFENVASAFSNKN